MRELIERLSVTQDKNKFLGKDVRLTWDREGWYLEELPSSGNKKLRQANLYNRGSSWLMLHRRADEFIPDNILMNAKLKKSDDYRKVKLKIGIAQKNAEVQWKKKPENLEYYKEHDWLFKDKWQEQTINYLKVTPENADPIKGEGKDFTVASEWTTFSAYSPGSDFQGMDPSYTEYESKSPTAARKLYKILSANPKALKGIGWRDFSGWLKQNKINYKTNFSVWR